MAVEVPESQTTAITWEDPQEREARLHLQHQLTKDTQEIINNNHKLLSKEMENENRESDNKENKSLKEPGMTTDGAHNNKTSSKTLVFMLLGMNEERSHYTQLVEELGGVVSQADYFDPSTTHVITPRPSRSERNLGSIASGKWFLHDSYLEESSRLGYFVKEEPYAWGNPEATSLPKLQPGTTEAQLATAAWRWRQIIYRGVTNDNVGTVRGAFQSMTALICSSAERIGAFTRLIKAGGGKVVKARPPFSDVKDITHFFWEPNKTTEKVDLANFASRQIPCLNPVYLSHYLIQEAAPNESEHYVPEYRDIITNMSTPNHSMIKRKRK